MPAITVFGGVPISVAIPPILAPYATASIITVAKLRRFLSDEAAVPPSPMKRWTTDKAMGRIIMAVAVLLIHMLSKAVASRVPRMMGRGPVPELLRMERVIPNRTTYSRERVGKPA